MTLFFAALLGVVQGLTEFLPVSSSAHLIIGRAVLGWDADKLGLAFDVACHVGTLVAVLAYFRRDILEMLAAVPRLFGRDPAAYRARLIAVGTIPVVIVGLTLVDAIEAHTRTPLVSAVMLTIGAAGLLWVERLGPRRRGEDSIGYADALALGVAQSTALVPGVSRSGATITIGMLAGLNRAAAARFSFLLGVPAIMAAAGKEGLDLVEAGGLSQDTAALFGVGMLTSAIVGYLTIKYFLRFLGTHRLDGFAYYRLALAAVVFVWLAARPPGAQDLFDPRGERGGSATGTENQRVARIEPEGRGFSLGRCGPPAASRVSRRVAPHERISAAPPPAASRGPQAERFMIDGSTGPAGACGPPHAVAPT